MAQSENIGTATQDKDYDVVNENKIDFKMADMDSREQSIREVVANNKLTIIDFWASWCGPCRQEMPRLVHLYNMYKDRGLGIIGISLDEERESWEAAVRQMNMNWLQLSDLKGWDNAAAVKYGITSIPFTIVVDSASNVMAAGLRGNSLAELVERELGE